mgnify:CR=1 FL=1
MPDLEVLPPEVNISFYAGDGVSYKLVFKTNEDPQVPIPIPGTIEAQIRVDRGLTTPILVSFSTDMSEADPEGIVYISLTGEQTQDLVEHVSTKKGKFKGVWDVEWTAPGSEPRTVIQGDVECLADVTR